MSKYQKGTYKVKCDRTGAVVNSSDCRMQWNGLYVLKSEWEPRHPQDISKPARDKQSPPIPRPQGIDHYIDASDVSYPP